MKLKLILTVGAALLLATPALRAQSPAPAPGPTQNASDEPHPKTLAEAQAVISQMAAIIYAQRIENATIKLNALNNQAQPIAEERQTRSRAIERANPGKHWDDRSGGLVSNPLPVPPPTAPTTLPAAQPSAGTPAPPTATPKVK